MRVLVCRVPLNVCLRYGRVGAFTLPRRWWHWRTALVTRSRLAPQHALEIHQVAERLGGIRVTARQADVPRAEAVGHRVAVLPEPHALLRKREKHLAPEREE